MRIARFSENPPLKPIGHCGFRRHFDTEGYLQA
jgi:hypothetical protein